MPENQPRVGGVQLEWNGKRYGVIGDIKQGALNIKAARAIIKELAKKGFPVDEVGPVFQLKSITEDSPPYDYVITEMLDDWSEIEDELDAEDNQD